MKQYALYQVDAFTDRLFHGNPAAVVPLSEWLSDCRMLQIAQENNLSETAYIIEQAAGVYQIRWFSPVCEIDFCGHATLAAAFVVLKQQPHLAAVRFITEKVGELQVERHPSGGFLMDFPARPPQWVEDVPDELLAGLSQAPRQVLRSDQAWFAIYDHCDQVLALKPDLELLKTLWPYDVVVTAPGHGFEQDQYDLVSRYFWPANGGAEDPVTGSIHAGLGPYWGERLGKDQLHAYQASARGGRLQLTLQGDRVQILGHAVLYMQGHLWVPQ